MRSPLKLTPEQIDALALNENDEGERLLTGEYQTRKYSSQKTLMNILLVVFHYRRRLKQIGGRNPREEWVNIPHEPEQEPYKSANAIVDYLNLVVNSNEGEQGRDAKELEWSLTHEQLLDVVSKMGQKVQDLEAYQEGLRPMSMEEMTADNHKNYRILFDWLAYVVMICQSPLRGDWADMKLSGSWRESTVLHPLPKDDRNFLYQKDGQFQTRTPGLLTNRYVMCINNDKVSDKKGSDQIACSLFVSDCLTTSFRLWPRTYAFAGLDSPNKSYGESLSDYLREIRNPWSGLHNLHQGTQLLRSSYVTWFYNRRNPQPDHNAKETLARCMRHNWTIAETNYRKLPIEQIKRGAFNAAGEFVPTDERIDEFRIGAGNIGVNDFPEGYQPDMPPPPVPPGHTEHEPADMEFFEAYEPYRMNYQTVMAIQGERDRGTIAEEYVKLQAQTQKERNRKFFAEKKDRIMAKRAIRKLSLRQYKPGSKYAVQACLEYKLRVVNGQWMSERFPDLTSPPFAGNPMTEADVLARVVAPAPVEPLELGFDDLVGFDAPINVDEAMFA